MRRDRMTRRFGRATFGAVAAALVCAVVLVAAPQLAATPNAVPGPQAAMSSGDVLGPIAPDPQPEGSSWLPADAADETQVKTDADGTAYEAGVALVKIAEGADAAQLSQAIAQTGLAADASIAPDEAARSLAAIELAPGVDEQQAAEAFANLEGAELSQPNFVYELDVQAQADGGTSSDVIANLSAGTIAPDAATTTDPYRKYQDGYLNSINAPEAWVYLDSMDIPDHSVTVAVLDTGLQLDHEDLQGAVVGHYDAWDAVYKDNTTGVFTDYGHHGTHVAGIIAAVEGNSVGTVGVGHNKVGVLPVKVFNAKSTTSSALYEAYRFVNENAQAYNIRVANMSLGGARGSLSSSEQLVIRQIAAAADQGVLTVCSGGNESTSAKHWPVDFAGGLGVIALDGSFNYRASYSNFNAEGSQTKQISAPGAMYSTVPTNRYQMLGGTSMAAPVVSGTAALVAAVNPALSPSEIQEAITSTATDLYTAGFDAESGYGRINELQALISGRQKVPNVGSAPGDGDGSVRDFVVTNVTNKQFTGAKITQNPTVYCNGRVLVEGTDYKLTYTKNTDAGTATMKVTGKGAYAGTKATATFEITPVRVAVIANGTTSGGREVAMTKWSDVIQKDAGAKATQNVKLTYGSYTLKKNKDYKLAFSSNTVPTSSWPGRAQLEVQLMGNFQMMSYSKGSATNPFTYMLYDPSLVQVGSVEAQAYTGAPVEPKPQVTYNGVVVDPSYYTLSYADNVNTGTGTVIVNGANGFEGEVFGQATFDIIRTKIKVADAVVTGVADKVYDGQPHQPKPVVQVAGKTLTEGVDYTLTYGGTAKTGKTGSAYVTVRGKGDYTGTKKVAYAITPLDFTKAKVVVSDVVVYNGEQQRPLPVVTYGDAVLKKGTDYSLAYGTNVEPGLGSITVKGKGGYSGNITVTFPIGKIDVASTAPTSISAKTYTGKALTTAPTLKLGEGEDAVELVKGVDYTVTHENNVNVGTARVIYTGIGEHFTGTKVVEFTIQPRKISSASLSGRKTSLAYTGAPVTQAITLKYGGIVLREGVDYRVTYADNVNVGTATMTITGLGNFDSAKTYTFKIK